MIDYGLLEEASIAIRDLRFVQASAIATMNLKGAMLKGARRYMDHLTDLLDRLDAASLELVIASAGEDEGVVAFVAEKAK